MKTFFDTIINKNLVIKFPTGILFAFLSHTVFVWYYTLTENLSLSEVNSLFYYSCIFLSFTFGVYISKYIKIPSFPVSLYLITDWGIKSYLKELIRPWKLISLIGGIISLILGSYIVKLPDWDIGLSIMMALLAYTFSSWSLALLLSSFYLNRNKIISIIFFLFFCWLTVDGSYVIYNEIKGSMYFRLPNALASSLLYFICAGIWTPRDDFKSIKF
jgi:hypothetical protein